MDQKKYVAYIRRSKKETTSTLGIEAQIAEVERYVRQTDGQLIHTFTEIESGTSSKLDKRIVVWRAIEHCKANNATLVIAKLDRLARDVEFTSRLLNSNVKFVACDIPSANEFTIHVMAAVAEQEAKRISERTRAALAAKKARGEPLGYHAHKIFKHAITPEARERAAIILREKQNNNIHSKRARNYAVSLHRDGKSLRQIANIMNLEGFKSPQNKEITQSTVVRWLQYQRKFEKYLAEEISEREKLTQTVLVLP